MQWGIIADDNTGATDAAGMLTERGVRAVLVLDAESLPDFGPALDAFDAIVVGTQNRSLPAADAKAATRRAVRALRARSIERFQIKYSSTFDSTPEGNIGPTLDTMLEELGTEATIVCPALPVNGRTVYKGHLFVGDQLLSESALCRHPLNPMTDANLVRWLSHQTEKSVGLVDLEVIHSGTTAIRKRMQQLTDGGCAYLVTDALTDADLVALARATTDWPLITGSSGITGALGAVHYPGRESLQFGPKLSTLPDTTLVVSGSQSPMTRQQNDHARANGFADIVLDVAAAIRGEHNLDVAARDAAALLSKSGSLLLHSPSEDADGIHRAQELGASLGLTETETGERISGVLAALARRLMSSGEIGRLVISGGETSGAVCRALGVTALEVGLPLSPGVPYCFPLSQSSPLIVLKSGNFGTVELYSNVRCL